MVTISVQPQDQQVIIGGTLDLSVSATGNGTLHYQWKHGLVNVGTDSASYQDTDFQDADRGSYTVDVTDDDETKVSDAADVTVEPNITVQPASDAVIIGGHMELSVTATGHSPITYQWKKGGSPILLETSDTLVIDPFADGNRGNYSVDVTCDGNTVASDLVPVTVAPDITLQPISQAVTIDGSFELIVEATGHAPIAYQWYKNDVLLTGKTSANLIVDPYADSDRGDYRVEVTSDGNMISSDVANVSTQPKITVQPHDTPVEIGGSADLTVSATGHPTLLYQWYKDDVLLVGKVSSTLHFDNFSSLDRGTYYVTVECDENITESDSVVVSVVPTIVTDPQSQNSQFGETITLSVVATGFELLTYQWKHNGSPILHATNTAYVIQSFGAADRGDYTCEVTCDGNTVESGIATLKDVPVIVTDPIGQSAMYGDSVTLSVVATGYAPITYQWKKGGSVIGGATNSSLVINPFTESDRGTYTCEVTSDTNTVTSAGAILTVQPKINTQPASQEVSVGSPLNLFVVAVGHSPVTYQWRKDFVPISGETSDTFQIAVFALTDAGAYDCLVSCDGNTTRSNSAIVSMDAEEDLLFKQLDFVKRTYMDKEGIFFKVNGDTLSFSGNNPEVIEWRNPLLPGFKLVETFTYQGSTVDTTVREIKIDDTDPGYLPIISQQPVSGDYNVHDTITLTIVATGTGTLHYQWSKDNVNVGTDSDELDIVDAQTTDAGDYKCVVSNSFGDVLSNVAVIGVTGIAPSVDVDPLSQIINVGDTLTLTVTASGTTPLHYQWKKNGSNVGTDSDTYEKLNAQESDTDDYTCVVTNDFGSDESEPASVEVGYAPTIDVDPISHNLTVGNMLTLTVTASGTTPLHYQWKQDGSNVGTDSATYQKTNAQESDGGSYVCFVTNDFGSISSAAAIVEVGYAPTIDVDPSDQNINVGDTLTLTVTASGTIPLHYQWKQDGSNVGTDSDTYEKVNAQEGDSGDYTCVVTNDFGSISSAAAIVEVGYAPTIDVDPSDQNINVGDTLTLTVTASGTIPLHYQWKQDGSNVGTDSDTYEKVNAQEGDSGDYTCVVTNDFGSISSAAAIVEVGYAPTIDVDPSDQNINVGDTLTLTVTASGTIPLHYQWKQDGSNVGTDSDTYEKVNAQEGDSGDYTCVVTNDFGSIESNAATVTVTAGGILGSIIEYYYNNLYNE